MIAVSTFGVFCIIRRRRIFDLIPSLNNFHHLGRGDDEVLNRIMLQVPCYQIRIIITLLHSHFVENKVVHVYKNFTGRLWKYLDPVVNMLSIALRILESSILNLDL